MDFKKGTLDDDEEVLQTVNTYQRDVLYIYCMFD